MAAPDPPAAHLWVDIDDLIDYLEHHARPSGIQRVVYEISRSFVRLAPGRVSFVRRGADIRERVTLEWDYVETLYRQVMAAPPAAAEPPGIDTAGIETELDQLDAELAGTTLPGEPALPDRRGGALVAEIARLEIAVLRGLGAACVRLVLGALGRLATGIGARLGRGIQVAPAAPVVTTPEAEATPATLRSLLPAGVPLRLVARSGDVFVTLGAPWHFDEYSVLVRHLRDDLRLRFALLMYDLIPVRHPEWCNLSLVRAYTSWHAAVLPLVDELFAISDATARDVTRYLAELDIAPRPVGTLRLGSTFSHGAGVPGGERLVAEPYVLFVSTVEVRKNHTLLFRVWRRLLEEMPADEVPVLVFAGSEGWLVADLMQQLDNAGWLDGHIRFIRSPNDGELHRLYADCLFTVFPSFFEGWGLPVTESLGLGRPCIASNATSIPEAGGALARYFNPSDLDDACRVIRAAIEDRDGLAEWTRRVAREYRPVSWDEGAMAVLDTVMAGPGAGRAACGG